MYIYINIYIIKCANNDFKSMVAYLYVLIAPSKPPRYVFAFSVLETSAIVAWRPIPMIDHNGEILYYLIKYQPLSHTEESFEQERKVTADELTLTLSLLEPNSTYIVTIAGVNEAGVGVFSPPLEFTTQASNEIRLPGSCHLSVPGRVVVTSTTSTFDSITIEWLPPCDENNHPLNIFLQYSYEEGSRQVVFQREMSYPRWTVRNLDSGLDVHFSLKAINIWGKEGPSTKVTVRTADILVGNVAITSYFHVTSFSFQASYCHKSI